MNKLWIQKNENHYYNPITYETIQREYGKTPNGNNLQGKWVYRNKSGKFIDYDKYRFDLAERNNIKLP